MTEKFIVAFDSYKNLKRTTSVIKEKINIKHQLKHADEALHLAKVEIRGRYQGIRGHTYIETSLSRLVSIC